MFGTLLAYNIKDVKTLLNRKSFTFPQPKLFLAWSCSWYSASTSKLSKVKDALLEESCCLEESMMMRLVMMVIMIIMIIIAGDDDDDDDDNEDDLVCWGPGMTTLVQA